MNVAVTFFTPLASTTGKFTVPSVVVDSAKRVLEGHRANRLDLTAAAGRDRCRQRDLLTDLRRGESGDAETWVVVATFPLTFSTTPGEAGEEAKSAPVAVNVAVIV